LRALLPQFSAYFWPWSSLKVDIFLPPGVFCYGDDFKGTVARDFWTLFFSGINPNEPEAYSKRFSNLVSNRNTANLGYESGIHGVDS
jgi:hypothetical protein